MKHTTLSIYSCVESEVLQLEESGRHCPWTSEIEIQSNLQMGYIVLHCVERDCNCAILKPNFHPKCKGAYDCTCKVNSQGYNSQPLSIWQPEDEWL
jgi:hypothetical protein